jgi:hypothetical protein
LGETEVSFSQTPEASLRKVGIRPTLSTTLTGGIATMAFEELSPKSTADHPIVSLKHRPVAVTKVAKPTSSHLIDLVDRGFEGLA